MKVVTLNPSAFGAKCSRLADLVAWNFHPDLVVGIATGGVYVARNMFENLPHCSITCRRGTSAGKDKARFVFAMVRLLPLWVRDALRRSEARWLRSGGDHRRTATVDRASADMIRRARHILVVDDAVDSGDSMKKVIEKVRELSPHASVRTAAIALTTPSPAVMPDYYIYNQVLVRFPWSKDYR